ncbi:IPP transferase-domain-containing protein [Apodospora peruviana]|uniref:tRNA dimethylallyltransferase n=1 Tax=Apodospora peruviana TaxID=516989 RepID=A0AAE0IKJ9_9PEZI|nr:IPP transferase-domain-containing protein [Apodospora peruviana]
MRFTPRLCQISRYKRPVMDPLVVIYGSTGTGKSDLAVELATRFNGEVINADAMQMYKGLPIITNKIADEEQRGIPHHLLGIIGLEETPWTVNEFKREALRIISEIRSRGKLPIVVGGTSYYLDALLFDEKLVTGADGDGNLFTRDELDKRFPILLESGEVMLKKLREVDPVMAKRWHPNDKRRIRGSLEIYFTTGRRASDIYAEQRNRKEPKWLSTATTTTGESNELSPNTETQSPWKTLMLWVYADLERLNSRLEKRVDKMVENGLLCECAEVHEYLQTRLAAGETVDRTKGIWQSIGFKQFEPYLQAADVKEDQLQQPGEPLSAAEQFKQAGIYETKAANRQYARKQVRWITYQTIAALQSEQALDRLFLLDSTDVARYRDEVLTKGAELTRKLLAGEPLPPPTSVSETARQVLTAQVARCNRQVTLCNKTCDICEVTAVTEEQWTIHINSNRHRARVNRKKRRSLVAVQQKQPEIPGVLPPPGIQTTDHPTADQNDS